MSQADIERDEYVPNPVANPFRTEQAAPAAGGALVSIEQQRAVAEVQARMIIARANPRDPIRCMDAILQDCTRPSLADGALYQFARGGSSISGPSIRLAEALARRWGNIASGIKEISRHNGMSECVAYAWDLETGYYDERQFQIRHWRDTKQGGYLLKDERDIYELIANMGQRRKRAVLLTVIPSDVQEAAIQQCEETMKASADTSPEALKKIVDAFVTFGITPEQLAARCQCRLEAIRPTHVVQLRKIYASLKDEMSKPEDWFALAKETVGGVPAPESGAKGTAALKAKMRGQPEEKNAAAAGGKEGTKSSGGAEVADALSPAAEELKAPLAKSAPDSDPDPDRDRATRMIADLDGLAPDDVRALAANTGIKTVLDRWEHARPELAAEVKAALSKAAGEGRC